MSCHQSSCAVVAPVEVKKHFLTNVDASLAYTIGVFPNVHIGCVGVVRKVGMRILVANLLYQVALHAIDDSRRLQGYILRASPSLVTRKEISSVSHFPKCHSYVHNSPRRSRTHATSPIA